MSTSTPESGLQPPEPELHPDAVVIGELGGPTEVGKLCGIRAQAVSQWKRHGMPRYRRDFLQLLKPDAFARAEQRKGAGNAQ